MLQTIKNIFFQEKKSNTKKSKVSGGKWAERQIREMAKLGGKLVL